MSRSACGYIGHDPTFLLLQASLFPLRRETMITGSPVFFGGADQQERSRRDACLARMPYVGDLSLMAIASARALCRPLLSA
jgi:hypothetical protein